MFLILETNVQSESVTQYPIQETQMVPVTKEEGNGDTQFTHD